MDNLQTLIHSTKTNLMRKKVIWYNDSKQKINKYIDVFEIHSDSKSKVFKCLYTCVHVIFSKM